MNRLKISIIPVIVLVLSFLIFGPLELCLSNGGSEEFWFSFTDVILPLIVLAVASVAVLTGLIMLLPDRAYRVLLAVVVSVCVLMLLQGIFLPNGYGELNGAQIDWSQYTVRLIYNSAVWLAVMAAAIVWAVKKWNSFREIAIWAVMIVFAVQAVSLVTLGITGRCRKSATDVGDVFLTTEKEYTVSGTANTIVFILDAFDSQLMCDLLEQYPDELRESFADFTFYHNTNGGATRTKYAIPYILTGRINDTGMAYGAYLEDSFQTSPLFQELRTGKYDTGIYTEGSYVDRSQNVAIDNLSSGIRMKPSSAWGLTGSLLKMTAFKYAPHAAKPAFWMYSFELSQWKGGTDDRTPYRSDDIGFYNGLCQTGLSVSGSEPGFRFIHMNGAHAPFTMDENIARIANGFGREDMQGLGSLRIVAEYIRQLKQMGRYDDATLVIMADHGDSLYLENASSIDKKVEHNPLLMIKPAHESHDFRLSDVRLTYQSLPGMLADALRQELDVEKNYVYDGTFYFYVGVDSNNTYRVIEYASDGDAYDDAGYHETGVVFQNDEIDYAYALGTELFFGERKGVTIKPYLVKGFSYIDPDYTWSSEYSAEFCFDVGKVSDNLLLSFNYERAYHSYQRCYVYASDVLIGSFIARGRENQSLVIPKDAVVDGILTITMQFPDSYNPVKHGTGADDRQLGISFDSLTIDKTDKPFNADEQLSISEYELGTMIIFGPDGNMDQFQIQGVSNDHWTSSDKATLIIDSIDGDSDYVLSMTYNVHGDRQRVIVFANGTQIADYTAEGYEQKDISIPGSCIDDGRLEIELQLPDAAMPDNGDQRKLGLWMEKLTVQAAPKQ